MRCPSCKTENREERRFCSSCGAGLNVVCRACDFLNEPGDEFCGGCGTRLAAAGGEKPGRGGGEPRDEGPSGDRRQLTILFADLSGYTALSEVLDAEDLHGLVGLVFDAIDRIVEDHGGTVHRHVGDEVMALFGAPVAHSDDPIRAVLAAFEAHRAMTALGAEQGRDIAVHVGIASGSVVIAGQGKENPEAVPDYAVTGVAANLAARLNSLAEPGETIISDTVYRAVEEHVDCDALGETKVKGLAKPVLAWRAKELRAQGRKRRDRRFIGRRAESAQFIGALESCRDTRTGQAILVRGEAGMGKTRLVEEFESDAEKRGFACHKGLIFDFGVGEGHDAIRTLVSDLLAVPIGSDIPAREAGAAEALAAGLCAPDQRVFLNDLLNLAQLAELQGLYDAMDIATRNRGKHALITGLIRRVCDRQPRLLVVEDVHWADAETLSDLAQITKAVQDCPAVLVMTSRIDGDPLDQTWRGGTGGSPLSTIDIGPLREAEAAQLAGGFVRASDEFARNCINRAGGNPLFLEQLLRSVEESGDEDVPATIQSLVLARIDRLEGPDKRALQAASAIGQRFALEALQAVVGDPNYSCAPLIERHLVRPEGDEYLFAHALIQESVYASLLKDTKGRLHRHAAQWFADRDPVLHAEHLDRAEDPAAPRAYLQAARTQAADYHYDQASRLVGRGLEIAHDPADMFGLNSFRAKVLLDMGSIDESIAGYEGALQFADNDIERCQAWLGLAAGMRIADRYDDALETLDKADAVARIQDMVRERAEIHHMRGNLYFPLGRIEECAVEHEKSLNFARESGSVEAEANSLGGLGDASYMAGRMDTAFRHFSRCVEVAHQNGLVGIEVANRSMVGFTRLYLNQLQQALKDGLETVDAAAKVGHQRAEMLGEHLVIFVLFEMAEYAKAREHNARALNFARQLGSPRFEAQALMYEGKFDRARGRRDQAIKTLETALEMSADVGHGFAGPRIVGEMARNLVETEAKRAALAHGEHMLEAGSVSHNHFFFYPDAIEVSIEIGDWGGVERYAAALEDFTRSEPLPWCNFFIARGRALAAWGQGRREAHLMAEIQALCNEAERVNIATALPALKNALKST